MTTPRSNRSLAPVAVLSRKTTYETPPKCTRVANSPRSSCLKNRSQKYISHSRCSNRAPSRHTERLPQKSRRGDRHGIEIPCVRGNKQEKPPFHPRVPEPSDVIGDRGHRLLGVQVSEMSGDAVDHPDLGGKVERHVHPQAPRPARYPRPPHPNPQ